jgi:hypothetical protein
MSGDSEAPPTYYFDGITFNPSFYTSTTTSNYLTLETAKNIFLTYPAAQGTETISTLNSSTINSLGLTLSIGTNGTTGETVIIGTNSNTQTSIYGGAIGLLSNTTVSGNLTSNSYNLTGNSTTLTKLSLGYYVNYTQNSASYSTSNKFLYAPGSNTSQGEAHYLYAGVYIANIHLCVVASAGQTYSGRFSLGVSAGTNIQAMPANSQYGIMNIESSDLTALNTGVSLAGNFSTYSHSGCFTLTSSNFVNLELNLKAQTGAAMTFYLYGCIHRIA